MGYKHTGKGQRLFSHGNVDRDVDRLMSYKLPVLLTRTGLCAELIYDFVKIK